jgi:hypothetical protein
MLKQILVLGIGLAFIACQSKSGNSKDFKKLKVSDYKEAVYASWIGQIIGNTYGLCYEFTFIEESGPDSFPYGYTWTLDSLRKYNGAFSDDDTDIEYMYLAEMEKHGIEPGYYQLAEAWKKHVKRKVWCANRVALTLMHAGHYPPVTGSKQFNPQWMQIDPQLVNEIWAVTAPGMVDYAVDKSEFAAKITNDSFGVEPTLHYAAMYSAAFFEKDIHKLIEIGKEAIGRESRFSRVLDYVKELYHSYPDDWQNARKAIVDRYYVSAEYNKHAWPVIDAHLNGALGILALLYGDGDFQKTLDLCCAFGMDADNQAATMCGLLGIVNGLEGIPRDLMFPLKNADWEKPFNDSYKMVTREGLEDDSLSRTAERIARQGRKIILAYGGEVIETGGEKFYKINPDAEFIPPFELNPVPNLFGQVDESFSYPIYTGGKAGKASLSVEGELPPGIDLENSTLVGTPEDTGDFSFKVLANNGKESDTISVNFTIRSGNLAPEASDILYSGDDQRGELEIIRDGSVDETFYSEKSKNQKTVDFYGYRWEHPQTISALTFNNGVPNEFGGWYTSFDVEYLKEDGNWKGVEDLKVTPEMNLENKQWLKPSLMDFNIEFSPVSTSAIRISGNSGGVREDKAPKGVDIYYYTTIAELEVFEE